MRDDARSIILAAAAVLLATLLATALLSTPLGWLAAQFLAGP